MKKIINLSMVFVLLVIMVLQSQVIVFAAEGNSKSNATALPLDEKYLASISKEGEHDWYKFTTGEEDAYYYITILNESGSESLYATLYDSRNSEIVYCYADTGRTGSCNVKLNPNSTYYIETKMSYWGVEKYTGNYTITLTKQNDLIGNDKSEAAVIDVNTAQSHSIDGKEDKDWFSFNVKKAGKYRISMTNESGTDGLIMYAYTQRDMEIAYKFTDEGESSYVDLDLEADSTYYVVFYMYLSATGNYSFNISQCVNGHTKSGTWETTKEPTCTEAGEKVMKCSVCDAVIQTDTIKASGHKLGEWNITKPATWISLGEKEATCEVCGELETGKDWSKVWIIPVIVLGAIVLIIGVVNYVKSFKKSRY